MFLSMNLRNGYSEEVSSSLIETTQELNRAAVLKTLIRTIPTIPMFVSLVLSITDP